MLFQALLLTHLKCTRNRRGDYSSRGTGCVISQNSSPSSKTKEHQLLLLLTIHTPLPRIAFVLLGTNKKRETGAKFLEAVLSFYLCKINYILITNGHEFTYNALPKRIHTHKVHPFYQICYKLKISHRTINFRHPRTNGMVERFNHTIRNLVLDKYLFSSIFEMNGQLVEFVNRYNQEKSLESLNYVIPAQYLGEKKNIALQSIVM